MENRKVSRPEEVFNLKEVQEIKDAIQEHFLFLGLDRANNIKNISLLGIGTSSHIEIDIKYIVRTALVTGSDKVILVHNHPSNSLEPSFEDKEISNITNQLLRAFNIQFLDHRIVGENYYNGMGALELIDEKYESERTKLINKITLMEENEKLKDEVIKLKKELKNYRKMEKETEDEYE